MRTSTSKTMLAALLLPLAAACAPRNDPQSADTTDSAAVSPAGPAGDTASSDEMAATDPAMSGTSADASGMSGTSADAGMGAQDPAMQGTPVQGSTAQGLPAQGMPAPGTPAQGAGTQDPAMAGTDMQDPAMRSGKPDPAMADPAMKGPVQAATFYKMALASGTGEADLSRHAVKAAQSSEVRNLAQTLVRDHDALNAKLRAASGMKEAQPKPEDKAKADAVKSQQGAAFDQAYLGHMAEGHAKSIALYQNASTNASDEKARALATQALPKLREHAAMVTKLQGASGSPASTP